MSKKKMKYEEPNEFVLDHDSWYYGILKLAGVSRIKLENVPNLIPFDGKRNPSGRSTTSNKVFFPYCTAANDWHPKIGMAESAAEAAVGLQAVMSKATYDVEFQPLTVQYEDEHGDPRPHTYDLRLTFNTGHRRLVFVRYEESLKLPVTARDIKAIIAGTPRNAADDVMIVNASDYTRQRRDNIMRMYYFESQPDDEADEVVLQVARMGRTFYYMKDLFSQAPISQPRAFAACHRLVGRGMLRANLDNVLWEHSHLELAA
jgi:hypothetical protein